MDRGNLEVERDRILAYKTVFASDTEKEASGVSRIVLEDIRDFAQYDTFLCGAYGRTTRGLCVDYCTYRV